MSTPTASSSLRIIPLGGLGEVGMNCLALEQRGEALVIDCGVSFGERGLGVDVVHPAFDALADLRVVGLFVTHGHEDHIGAIPYFLKRFDVPVYGPRYALGLVRDRASEHEVLEHARLECVPPGAHARVGSFDVEPIRVTHSTADATALAIRTDAGVVVHTGDFKFDDTPPDAEPFDVARFDALSREDGGVRVLLSDSTNVDASGPTGDEETVARALDTLVSRAGGAVVVSLFASNVHRLRELGDIAARSGRKLVLLGRGMAAHARVAAATRRATGAQAGRPYLEWPASLVWPVERIGELSRGAVLAIATGSQGEPAAALSRLASGEYPGFELAEGDTVVLSSRVIPGNENGVGQVMTALLRRGVEVSSWWSNRAVHVSGHAHREEQRRMIDLVRPRAFLPVHGTLHHLHRHASLAREAGVPEVCVVENGEVAEVDDRGLRKAGRVHAGRVFVFAGRAVPAAVVAARASIAAHGVVHVTLVLGADGRIARPMKLVSRGVVDDGTDGDVIARVLAEARQAVERSPSEDEGETAETARQAIRRAFNRALGFRPTTWVTVLREAP